MICNICDGTQFQTFAGRENAQCANCTALERTRALHHLIQTGDMISAGSRVLHFAPELGLAKKIRDVVGPENHDCFDLFPQRFNASIGVRKFDLMTDVYGLPSEEYDLVLHSHIMEHVPCWVAGILWHLHRSLKRTGVHLFCIPVMPGHSSEDIGPLSDEERTRRFNQKDHVRRFGDQDIERTIGTIFDLNEKTYNLSIDENVARLHNIKPAEVRRTIFKMRKGDLRLV
ncbi:hypothetical protein [Shinella sp.]|uniref:hypothetical protein n=1 Tax=Shinella sp. TaxID=1870904 RepID=UPI0040351C75